MPKLSLHLRALALALALRTVVAQSTSQNCSTAVTPHRLTTCPHGGPATRCRPCLFNADIASRELTSCHNNSRFKLAAGQLEIVRTTQQELCKVLHSFATNTSEIKDWWSDQTAAMITDSSYQKLCHGDNTQFREILDVYHGTAMVFGFSGGSLDPLCFEKEIVMGEDQLFYHIDSFMRLSEAAGVRHVYSPEHHGFGWDACQDFVSQLAKLEGVMGIDLQAPVLGGGLVGLNFKEKGVLTSRHFHALYMAWKLSHLLDLIGGGNICEIGGGMGYMSYYSKLFGVASSYTLIDIHAGLFSQHLLHQAAFGGDSGVHVVKTWPHEQSFGRGTISLLHAMQFPDFDFEGYHIVVNMDSFPEMAPSVIESYFKRIKASSTVRYLFSQNQESRISDEWTLSGGGSGRQNSVKDLAAKFGFRTLARHLAWMRMGYVEMLFAVNEKGQERMQQQPGIISVSKGGDAFLNVVGLSTITIVLFSVLSFRYCFRRRFSRAKV